MIVINKNKTPERCSFCVYFLEKTKMTGECHNDKDNVKKTKVFNVCTNFK